MCTALVFAAVVMTPPATAKPPAIHAADAGPAPGHYACSFSEDGTPYPPYECLITRRAGSLWLEKKTGSQRLKGNVEVTGTGFRFKGTFFCPLGDCTQPVSADFTRDETGVFRGTLRLPPGARGPTTEMSLVRK
jgi:hypothetical protein